MRNTTLAEAFLRAALDLVKIRARHAMAMVREDERQLEIYLAEASDLATALEKLTGKYPLDGVANEND